MAPLSPDINRRRRSLLSALLGFAALAGLRPASAARAGDRKVDYQGSNPVIDSRAGTIQLDEVKVWQGDDTRIEAQKAAISGLKSGAAQDSRWELTSKVHIQFEDALLDADAATVQFRGGEITSIQVQGGPAKFSHQLKGETQRNEGHANQIAYDAASGVVTFNGNAWYTDGRNDLRTQTLTYNVNNGVVRSPFAEGTINPGRPDGARRLVPAPRTPDRSTAQ